MRTPQLLQSTTNIDIHLINTNSSVLIIGKGTVALATISSIFSIVGFIGVLIAIATYYDALRKRAAEKDVGQVCCDPKRMCYFAVKSPSPLNLWNCGKDVELPKVPKVSAIIEAGDDLVSTVSGHKSKRKTSKPRFYAFSTNHPTLMKLPGAPRKPLGEVSPNQRSRVVGSRDHGIPFPVIARMESLRHHLQIDR